MKEYINDLKFLLFFLAIVIVTIAWKWDYLFSQDTLNEVKIVQEKKNDE